MKGRVLMGMLRYAVIFCHVFRATQRVARTLAVMAIFFATPVRAADIATGLVGYWKLDGNASDSSGKGKHGTLIGGTPTKDRFGITGASLSFNGSSDYITLPTSTLAYNSSATYAAWIDPENLTQKGAILGHDTNNLADYSDALCGGFWLKTSSFRGTVYSNTGYQVITTAATAGVWQHIVFVKDIANSQIKLYKNGVLISTVAFTPATLGVDGTVQCGLNRLMVARFNSSNTDGPQDKFNGYIDDVRIYNRALTADDVLALYNNGGPSTVSDAVVSNAVIR